MKERNPMKKSRKHLTLPAIREFREAIKRGDIGGWLVESGEKVNAGSVKLKYKLINRPWVVTVEAKRIYDNKQ